VSKKKHEEALAAKAAELAALQKQFDDERAAKMKLEGDLATLEGNLNMKVQEIKSSAKK
jgi:hypothetical protein